ncbi:dTMP kinase [Altererythrobacter aquiaggeris]|uniref:dTMP kinase n=1 Tax=Aestuarierythrobacter aquiaggeris TaxID=1898396 RepID=UPI003017FF9C
MVRGKFIAFEGGEGAGKSTQAAMLASALGKRGIECILTREPGGTGGAENIRHLLLSSEGEGWGPRAEALLFAAARSDHVEKTIRPTIEQGKWVICDRFVDSSRAYQGGAGGLGDKDILTLHDIGSEGLLPDLTFLIEVPASMVSERLVTRDGGNDDRIGGRSAFYHAKVAAAFSQFADEDPGRFARIDGTGSPAAIHAKIVAAIAPLLADD